MNKTRNSLTIVLFLPVAVIITSSCSRKSSSINSTRKLKTVASLPDGRAEYNSPASNTLPNHKLCITLPERQNINIAESPGTLICKTGKELKTEIHEVSKPLEQKSGKTLIRIPILSKIIDRQRKGPKYYFQKAEAQGNAWLAIGCLVLLGLFILAAVIIATA